MFPYWSAPPSLLRTWASPDDSVRARDDKLHFRSLAVQAGEELGSFLGDARCYVRCYVRALFSFRIRASRLSDC